MWEPGGSTAPQGAALLNSMLIPSHSPTSLNKGLVFHLLPLSLLGEAGKVRSRDPGVAAQGFTKLLRSSFLSFGAGCCLGQKSKISRNGASVSAAGERELLVVETSRKLLITHMCELWQRLPCGIGVSAG